MTRLTSGFVFRQHGQSDAGDHLECSSRFFWDVGEKRVLDFLQKNGFLIVLLTLVPLLVVAAITSHAGKSLGNMTPWEPAKIPFLIGFAAILAILYKNLARTYWGVPRAKDVLPLVVMAILPFVPFFVLKDFGQMMVFSSVYATLYLSCSSRFSQRFVLIGSVMLVLQVLIVGALPVNTQEKIPLLPTLAGPVKKVLPNRIQQRFHLWLDGFDPPTPDTAWWKKRLRRLLQRLIVAKTLDLRKCLKMTRICKRRSISMHGSTYLLFSLHKLHSASLQAERPAEV